MNALVDGDYRVEVSERDANNFLTKMSVVVKNGRVQVVNIDARLADGSISKKHNKTYNHLMKMSSGTSFHEATDDLEAQVYLKLTHYYELKDRPILRVKGARFLTKDVREMYQKLIEDTNIIEGEL